MDRQEIQKYTDNEMLYIEKIISALNGIEEMTEELFEMALLITVEEPKIFFQILEKYPSLSKEYFDNLEKELEYYERENIPDSKILEKLDNWFYDFIKK